MTYFLTLAFMFLVFWRPQEWLLPWLFGWPLLDVVVYAAVVGLALESNMKSAGFPKTPAIGLAAGLWFASIMSHVPHTYFQGILNTVPETFKISFFLVLLLIVMDNVERLRGVVLVFVIAAVIMSVHAVMQKALGYGLGGGEPLIWTRQSTGEVIQQSQFYGIFADPNDLGQILAASIPLVFAFPRRLRAVQFILTVGVVWLIVVALLTTHSRGTLVGVIAIVACMGFLALPARMMPYVAIIALVGGLVACVTYGASLLDISGRERIVFWGDANRAFKQNPIFGIGYGMFYEVTAKARASHNAYVNCYTELGLFGYWFWFNLLTLGVIGCWRTRKAFHRPRNGAQAYLKRLAGLSIASLTGFAASSYFLSRAYVFPFIFLFGLLNSIPLIAQRYLPEDHPPLINFRKDVMITGTIATVASVAYVYVSVLILNSR
jgi:putative inorganic carbon (HCO3(-)) transporter